MTHTLLVYVTTSNRQEAEKISRALIEEKLVACANIYPEISSLYEWEGQLQEETEIPLIVKTTEALFQKLTEKVRSLHSYECPCIVALPIKMGYSDFIQYIKGQCQSPS